MNRLDLRGLPAPEPLLQALAAAEGGRLTHVKPHGGMNNMACEDAAMATTIARTVKALDRELILLAPALSALERAGETAGLRVAREVFADYLSRRQRQPHFANARSVRNALDRMRLRQASRLFADRNRALSRDDLITLTAEDIRASRVFDASPSP